MKQIAKTREIGGRQYVIGDRLDERGVPQGHRAMKCANGCGYQLIVDPGEIATVLAEQASPLCMPCAIRLEGGNEPAE